MNKSDREKLGSIVASMLYEFSSSPQLVDAGEHILKTFPCIEDEVRSWRYTKVFHNILSSLRAECIHAADPVGFNHDVRDIAHNDKAQLEEALDIYLEDYDDDENSWLFRIEGQVGAESFNSHSPVLAEFIRSPEWASAVSQACEPDSDAYALFTGQIKH